MAISALRRLLRKRSGHQGQRRREKTGEDMWMTGHCACTQLREVGEVSAGRSAMFLCVSSHPGPILSKSLVLLKGETVKIAASI